jgi:hypothetical protein
MTRVPPFLCPDAQTLSSCHASPGIETRPHLCFTPHGFNASQQPGTLIP